MSNINKDIKYKKGVIRQNHSFFISDDEVLSFFRLHVDELATLFSCGEYHNTVDEREESVILAHAYIQTGMMHCATLTFDNVTCFAV